MTKQLGIWIHFWVILFHSIVVISVPTLTWIEVNILVNFKIWHSKWPFSVFPSLGYFQASILPYELKNNFYLVPDKLQLDSGFKCFTFACQFWKDDRFYILVSKDTYVPHLLDLFLGSLWFCYFCKWDIFFLYNSQRYVIHLIKAVIFFYWACIQPYSIAHLFTLIFLVVLCMSSVSW